MAIIKCKMCGGDLALTPGSTIATCEYCGSTQTVPSADNEKKLNLFAGANKLRAECEFDRAAGIYDTIKAEFPSEPEAYWGLVLCKYGIEYVDDPATGKKVPTCHRSGYDIVLEDPNLELAMDYADPAARKMYREEARLLEKIRVGILEVSAREKPYDIFICYKETDPNGDRTLDSVLAQDLYTALTDRGYRVFFSRITLQSKLGEAYEPYIFAALNSAKVMLVIGTDPEYYNAVWVKNEWSRYLKICAADKSKHLIPCYKDMDAYDMPREFRPLQAVDLGKMGAVQDILFNMEKYIPLKKNATVIQERVVVGGGGDNKIASLLDRGNMALEDGDWAKADSFFEDVLNNDSKNAQAYLGKTLAQEKCRTMDALVRKRRDAYQNVRSETRVIEPREAHIREMAAQYSLPGYVEAAVIRELYDFDLRYESEVSGRQKQYREEENWWQNHRQLSRAEKFAVGAVAEQLQSEKKHLFAQLADRVKQAEAAEATAKKDVQERYETHLKQADEQAQALYQDGLSRREQDYRKLLQTAKASADVAALTETAKKFDALGDYQDSRNLAEHCRRRIADLTAEAQRLEAEQKAAEAAEAERKRIEAEKAAAAKKKKNTIIGAVSAVLAVAAIAAVVFYSNVIVPKNKRAEAEALVSRGSYEEAIAIYQELAEPESVEQVKEAAVQMLMDAGEYESAFAWAQQLADSESVAQVKEAAVQMLMDSGEYERAFAWAQQLEDAQQKEILLTEIAKHGRYLPDALHCYGTDAGFHIEYTADGWPAKITGFGNISNDETLSYEYDRDGNLIRCRLDTNSSDYKYTLQWIFWPGKAGFHVDALTKYENATIQDSTPLPLMRFSGVAAYEFEGEDLFFEYSYDEDGYLTEWKLTYANGETSSGTPQWEKDDQGRPIGWTNLYIAYDRSGITYDQHGYMTHDTISRTYDELGRITSRRVYSANDSDEYSYQYDELGRVVTFMDWSGTVYTVDWSWHTLEKPNA